MCPCYPYLLRTAVFKSCGWWRTGEERIDRLLARSMFHLHRERGVFRADLRAKIVVVPGDLLKPRCGLSAADEKRLVAEVDFVVHSAACIVFEEHIHNLLAQNLQARLIRSSLQAALCPSNAGTKVVHNSALVLLQLIYCTSCLSYLFADSKETSNFRARAPRGRPRRS